MEPRAAVFDLGNVVLDFDFAPMLAEAARRLGRPAGEILRWFSDPGLQRDFECGRLAPEAFFRDFAAAFRAPFDFDGFAALWNGIFRETPGTEGILRDLAGRVRLVAASNTNALHLDHVRRRFAVLSLFDEIVASCEIGCCKPDPSFYEVVLRRAGTRPERTVFVDDIPENVDGAVRAGMNGVLFRGAEDLRRRLFQLGFLP
jgi:FMN phosphatase YigB (HAD superfamily)